MVTKVAEMVELVKRSLNGEYLACYLLNEQRASSTESSRPAYSFLLFAQHLTSLPAFKRKLSPLALQMGSMFRNIYFFTPETISNHLELDPHFSHILYSAGRRVAGEDMLPDPPKSVNDWQLKDRSRKAFEASAILAPRLLSSAKVADILDDLVVSGEQTRIPAKEKPSAYLLYRYLAKLQSEIGIEPPKGGSVHSPATSLTDRLSFYEWEKRLLVVLPQMDERILHNFVVESHWNTMVSSLGKSFRTVHVLPMSILRYHLIHNEPASLLLQNLELLRGPDILADLRPPLWLVYQELGLKASTVLAQRFPQAYLLTDESKLRAVEHDYQNVLLNIQLRNELICKINHLPIDVPRETKLPQEAPHEDRISYLLARLAWWTRHYLAQMKEIKPSDPPSRK